MKLATRATVLLAALSTLSIPALADDPENARNLFVEQIKKPSTPLNIGVTYWLELERNGKKERVTNKKDFKSGDRLRIHMKSNIDAYAYIVMLQGSKGDRAVLYPENESDENKLKAGKEMVLPSGDKNLKFDNNPGLETLRIIVSRKPIDAEDQLKPKKEKTQTVVVSNTDKDSIPDGTVVCIVVPPKNKISSGTRNLVVESNTKPQDSNETTVVGKDPNKMLTIDIALNHLKGG